MKQIANSAMKNSPESSLLFLKSSKYNGSSPVICERAKESLYSPAWNHGVDPFGVLSIKF